MNDALMTWLRQQLDDDERWALAANQPYRYAADGASVPPTGVHWRWVHGPNWETVTPDPAINEFVTEPGWPCHLVTVEEWPSRSNGALMPCSYVNEVVEMDAAAGGHIIRHDPARVLADVNAKRRILELHDQGGRRWVGFPRAETQENYCVHDQHTTPCATVRLLALPYVERPGYREEWRPQ